MKRNPAWSILSSLAIWEGVRSKDRGASAGMSSHRVASGFASLKRFDDAAQRRNHLIAPGVLVAAKFQHKAELALGSHKSKKALRRFGDTSFRSRFLTAQAAGGKAPRHVAHL